MRIIDWKTLKTMVPYSRQHIGRLETDPRYAPDFFPKRVQLGRHRVGWVYDEVVDWLKERANKR
jgi:predicted DNA-binding transcriptional regulator AlpA